MENSSIERTFEKLEEIIRAKTIFTFKIGLHFM
jgi:hypothetical protein